MKWNTLIGLLIVICLIDLGYRSSAYCGINPAEITPWHDEWDSTLAFPWAGGMNACQVRAIDLDLDGVSDLILFDRHGNRLIPLLYTGHNGFLGYHIDTAFVSHFPVLHDWVITADYDGDGRVDLFTYGLGAIRVFRNVSVTTLAFELVTNMITSWYFSGNVGILVTPVDYPAIADIDGDGDLDILSFFGLGSFVEYHQNMSQELYGNSDSLKYRLNTNCWGKFKESEGSNKITLNAECPNWKQVETETTPRHDEKHTGSTLLAIDLTNNGLNDLVLADIDYPNLIALFNDGDIDTAHIYCIDTLFPAGSRFVDLFDFPVVCPVDVNHDGLDELLVSSFNPSLTVANNYRSCWYYANEGTPQIPLFRYQTDQFLQEEMIDVGSNSYPLLADMNGDGLDDLLLGCWGRYDSSYYHQTILKSTFTSRITYYENKGTPLMPVFVWITDDLGQLAEESLTGLYPAAGDLNDDGFVDLVIGQEDGTLIALMNDGSSSPTPRFLAPVWAFQGIDVGQNSAPQLFDFDHDGRQDLIIGEQNGNLNYYHCEGDPGNPSFALITDSLGHVNVTNYTLSYHGYSTPCFFTDNQGIDHLLCGSEEGKIWYAAHIPEEPEAYYNWSDSLWVLVTNQPFPTRCGWRTAPTIGYLTSLSRADLILGNFSGGVNYFSHQSSPDVIPGLPETLPVFPTPFSFYPNPASSVIQLQIPPDNPLSSLMVSITSLTGQLLLETPLPVDHAFSIATLPAGIYLISISSISSSSTDVIFQPRKLIVVK